MLLSLCCSRYQWWWYVENAFCKWWPSSVIIALSRASPDFISLSNLPQSQSSSKNTNPIVPLLFLKSICGFCFTPVVYTNWFLQPHISTLPSYPATSTRNVLCSLPASLPFPLLFPFWNLLISNPLISTSQLLLFLVVLVIMSSLVPIICAPTVPCAYSYPELVILS